LRNYIERRRGSEKGFTLIELLVVIVILGILAAVVVFAVGGINDKGNTSACKIDTRTIRTAEEANFAKFDTYASESDLVLNKFLSEESTLHNIVLTGTSPDFTDFTIEIAGDSAATGPGTPEQGVDKKCGDADGDDVNGTDTL
jgi:prepilin-type N-terminal cleavage/methylation domain-containing protein